MKRFYALLLIATVVACGKRGDPHPPVPIIPKATSDLVVTQRGTKVILTWSYPSLTTAGKSLSDVRRVVVYRVSEELPVASTGTVDTSTPQPVNLFAKIPPLTPAQFTRERKRLDAIDASSLPSVTNGAKLVYEDTPQLHTSDGRPIRETYAVVTETSSARGDVSNLGAIVPIDVPSPPYDLKADPKAQGIVLSWQKPSDAKPDLPGYNVYRRGEKESEDVLAAPVNAAPVSTTTYTDTPAYGAFTYVVRAVASTGAPRIESDPSSAVTATFKDLTPPPAPASMNALIETHAVRLVWDPVTAPDLAGYMLYREEGVGHPEQPGGIKSVGVIDLIHHLINTTTYVDPDALLGISYRYAVTSVDKNGNESERVWTPWVTVPKTP
ncbi:MAG TPA: hypothetical protein VF381_00475 [Thermoanaerobaculia bacterium]